MAETRSILNEQVRNVIAHLQRLQVVETRSVLNEQLREWHYADGFFHFLLFTFVETRSVFNYKLMKSWYALPESPNWSKQSPY